MFVIELPGVRRPLLMPIDQIQGLTGEEGPARVAVYLVLADDHRRCRFRSLPM